MNTAAFSAVPGFRLTEIRALAERLEASLLYVNGPRLMPAVGRAGAGLPVLFHLHNHLSARNGLALVASAVRKTNATVIAASRFLAEPLERRLGRPVRVVYGGVEGPGNERPPRVPGSAAPRIGLIARVAAQKRQREFVLAAAALAKDWPHAEFYLCGDVLFGDRNAQRYKDETLALAPSSVRFLGWREEVYDVLANLDLLVLPSAAEGGVPRVILEAFAARVPVLASASGAIPEVVVEGQNGFLLASATGPAIAQRLRELLASPDRLAAAADRAYRLWRDRFTAGRYRDEVWEVVEAAASPSNRRKSHAESSPTAAVDTSAAE